MECKNLKTPNLFRILVIDDQICNDHECKSKTDRYSKDVQAAIELYFKDAVKKLGNAEIEVETKFAKDPEEGVYLWQSQIFDLTLVDSDFSKGETSRKLDSEKRSFLDLNLVFFGAYLYRFLREMQKKDRGRVGCAIALWTGLRLGGDKEQRADDLLSILPAPQKDDPTPVLFIPKQESYTRAWEEKVCQAKRNQDILVQTIEGCLSGMVQSNPVLNPDKAISDAETKAEAIIARIKSLYCIKPPEIFASLCNLKEPVYVGWLKKESGNVTFSDSWSKGSSLLSPLLRRGVDNDECVLDPHAGREVKKRELDEAERRKKEKEFFETTLLDIRKKFNGIIVPGDELCQQDKQQQIKSQTLGNQKKEVAAATPLTGCSAVGGQYAISLMVKKIKALLDGPFGKVVLKTVYLDSLDQWKDKPWPEVQAQQEGHITRCLRSTKHTRTLWNTGQTSMETFPPEMMNAFLAKMPEKEKYRTRVIVSLGSKFPQAKQKHLRKEECRSKLQEIWGRLFDTVFKDLDGAENYPLVEINVRHYLREAVEALLGGHEYLSPASISEPFTGNYDALDMEFRTWLSVLDETAKKHGKRLLLKLPFRGDIFHFISIIREFATEGKTSIAGITLINAFKSAEGETAYGTPYSPASYGKPDASKKQWRYQMSGEMLAASRNELMGGIVSLAEKNPNLEIHLSGGIVDKSGMDFCLNCASKKVRENLFIQIGSWALMDLNLADQTLTECQKDAPSFGNGKPQVTKCNMCSECRVNCPSGAFQKGGNNKKASIDRLKCTSCQKCTNDCRFVQLVKKTKGSEQENQPAQQLSSEELTERIAFCLHELCNGCGKCSRTFYCDTFMDRRGWELPPIMDARNCTGCGLCAQTCPKGAIQLFKPEHVAVLVGGNEENLSRWHKFLFANEIPHLVFDSTEGEAIKSTFLAKSIIIKAENACSLKGLDEIRNEVKYRLENYLRESE